MLNIHGPHIELLLKQHSSAVRNMVNARTSGKHPKNEAWFDQVLKDTFPHLTPAPTFRQIIEAKPTKLEEFKEEYHYRPTGMFPPYKKKKDRSEETKAFQLLYQYLSPSQPKNGRKFEVLNYKGKDYRGPYNSHYLFRKHGLRTCPYCNINRIDVLNNPSLLTGELDHFIPKTLYPIFSVSFFNLIPSCKICNKLKLAIDKPMANPLDSQLSVSDSFRFGIEVRKSTFPRYKNSFAVAYFRNPGLSKLNEKKIKNFLKAFRIRKQYFKDKDLAQEVIQKDYIFNDSYRDELYRKYGGKVFSTPADLSRAIFGAYERKEDWHKRSHSKFISDIRDHLAGRAGWWPKIDPKGLAPSRAEIDALRNQPKK